MNDIKIILNREFKAYFYSPIAYVFGVIFILLNSGIFMFHFFFYGNASMREFFSILPITLALIFIPAVSMRLWSEEKKLGTIELLMTSPLSSRDVVLGKFLAALTCIALMLLPTIA